MKWYYCLVHNRVEGEKGCANSGRLGPYDSEEQSPHARGRAPMRMEQWAEGERGWTQGCPKGREGEAAHDVH